MPSVARYELTHFAEGSTVLKLYWFSINSARKKNPFLYATSLSNFDLFTIILEMTTLERKVKITVRGGRWKVGVGIT
jgi:hypothetical protein